MNKEIWGDIPNYEGLYQASNSGRIKSLDKIVNDNGGKLLVKGRILKPSIDDKGYLQIVLTKNGKRKSYKIHRLIALTFISNPNKLLEVNHKNEIKLDNRVENLEWCTHKYNCNYGTRNYRCTKHRNHKVIQFDLFGTYIKTYNSLKEAEQQTNIKYQNIYACCINKIKQTKGYIWRYANE